MTALGDCFPAEFINTTDLQITRSSFVDDYGDETGSPTVIVSGLSAIVVPNKDRFAQQPGFEESVRVADIILDPVTATSITILQKDLVTWSDFFGTVTEAHVEEIRRVSGVPGLESVTLIVGRRREV